MISPVPSHPRCPGRLLVGAGGVIHVGAVPVKSLLGVGGGPFFWWFRRLLDRRVCGVAVKVERPQAKPRTNDLEGGVVRAMLVEPGRRNVEGQGQSVWSRVHQG